MKENKPRQ